ncbi:fibronectin type III domain-containing protein [Candidatus Poriferisodalis sp.]|uniref:fibronectin type III domain-containing protein n=1 Tax=Candidatus Poriferisodalis sp. TaxID=3101277 RepID=UPI003AF8C3F5
MSAALAAMTLAAAVLSPAVGASSSSLHPKGLSASLADGVVTLSWNAPIDDAGSVTGYQVLRRRPGVDPVGTFHVVAHDTATSDTSFVDRCADQADTAYTYRVKARRGDQLSRWGNYSRVNLPASYVAADPLAGCDPDTGKPARDPEPEPDPDPDPDSGDDGGDPDNGDDGGDPDDGDDGEGGVAGSAVSVRSDTTQQQDPQQDDKQFVPPPDDGEGAVVVRSSSQVTVPAQFQDRSTLPGLPASYPNSLGFDPGAPPAFAREDTLTPENENDPDRVAEITGHDASRFAPRNVTAELTDDGILISWQQLERPEWWACAEYDIVRVPGPQTSHSERVNRRVWAVIDGVGRWFQNDYMRYWVEEDRTKAYWKYTCVDRRVYDAYEIYRTSFGHVYRNGTVELLSDSQPHLIGTVIGQTGIFSFTDTSRDALVGPRRHIYQMRTLYGTDVDVFENDRDFGSRLSAGTFIERVEDAARPNAESPQDLTVSIPTKQAVADGTTLAIELDWDPPSQDASSVTGYVIQRRLVTQKQRALPFADVATITASSITEWADTGSDVTTTANKPVYNSAGNFVQTASYLEIAALTQFSYRVIAVRGTDRSNPSAVVSVDSERQLPAAGLVTVTDTWRTGATIRVNMTGTDPNGSQLGNHAKDHLALAPPRGGPENRLLHVGIGYKGWGHNTCLRNRDSTDTTDKVTVSKAFVELAPGSTATYTVTLEQVPATVVHIEVNTFVSNRIRVDGFSEQTLIFSPADAVNGKITKTVTVSGLAGSSDVNYAGWIGHTVVDSASDNAFDGLSIDPVMVVVSDADGPYGYQAAQALYLSPAGDCTHTDESSITVTGLTPGTTYTAEALFRLVSEEKYIGGQGAGVKHENFIPTWDGGFYPGGIWSPAHLVGTVTFTTNP